MIHANDERPFREYLKERLFISTLIGTVAVLVYQQSDSASKRHTCDLQQHLVPLSSMTTSPLHAKVYTKCLFVFLCFQTWLRKGDPCSAAELS